MSDLWLAERPRINAELSELGLHPGLALALRFLEPGEARPMSALAGQLQCDASTVTGIADRLEAAGIVERRPAEHDRRVKTLVVTPKGIELRGEVERRMSVPPPPLAGLSEEDAATMRDILERALEV